jgi:hypothetical protein
MAPIAHPAAWILLFVGLLAPVAVRAHFDLESNLRIVHVVHVAGGLEVLIRLPAPYVVARATPNDPDRIDTELAPFVVIDEAEGRTLHRFVAGAGADAADIVAGIVAEGHAVLGGDQPLVHERAEARIRLTETAPPFSTLAEARAAMATAPDPSAVDGALVGDTVIDAVLFYPAEGPVLSYSFGGALDPGLRGQDNTMNLLADHFGGATQLFQAAGTLATPIEVERALSLTSVFLLGVTAMVAGLPHVLFLLCLALGAVTATGLARRLGGFAIGHTLAFHVGVLGLLSVGSGAVAIGLALSVIVAATLSLSTDRTESGQGWRWLIVAGVLGLVHGLSFASDLRPLLPADAPPSWTATIAFNLGLEAGLALVALVVWPLSHLGLARLGTMGERLRKGILIGAIALAMVWIYQGFLSAPV